MTGLAEERSDTMRMGARLAELTGMEPSAAEPGWPTWPSSPGRLELQNPRQSKPGRGCHQDRILNRGISLGKAGCVTGAKPGLEAAAGISQREVSSTNKREAPGCLFRSGPGLTSHAALVLKDVRWGGGSEGGRISIRFTELGHESCLCPPGSSWILIFCSNYVFPS